MTKVIDKKEAQEKFLNTWNEFKRVNDKNEQCKNEQDIEDPITLHEVRKLNSLLDEYQGIMNTKNNSEELISYKNQEIMEREKAFGDYLRKGQEVLTPQQQKSLSTSVSGDGGYFVSNALSQEISRNLVRKSSIRDIAKIEKISTSNFDVIQDQDKFSSGWTGETNARADTNTGKIKRKTIAAYELFAQPKATQKLLDDAAIDVERWIADKIVESFSETENNAFVKGDGNNKPKGFLSYPTSEVKQIASGFDSDMKYESIVKIGYEVDEQYLGNAVFIMHPSTIASVRSVKDAYGTYLFQPSFSENKKDTLMGYPIITNSEMPTVSSNALAIAFGDFYKAYTIVEHEDVSILRDPYTDKPFVRFYATKRVGGDLVNGNAIRIMKISK